MRAWHLMIVVVVAVCWWAWIQPLDQPTGLLFEGDPIPVGTTRVVQVTAKLAPDGTAKLTANVDGDANQSWDVTAGLGPIAYAEIVGPTRRSDGSWEYTLRFQSHRPDLRDDDRPRDSTARKGSHRKDGADSVIPSKTASVRLSEEYVLVYNDQKALQSVTQITGDGKPTNRAVYPSR